MRLGAASDTRTADDVVRGQPRVTVLDQRAMSERLSML